MLKSLAVALSLGLAVVAVAHAQNPRTQVPPGAIPGQADMMKLQMTIMAAQEKAVRPGDEALPCEALQKELVSTMNDPAIQAYAAKTNETYAKELAAQQKKGDMTAASAAALAAALMPGTGMAGVAPVMPPVIPGQAMTPLQMQQMQQAITAQQQTAIAYVNQLAPIMPALMRSQRVSMLAVVKNCAWATGGLGPFPGAAVPGTLPPAGLVPR